ncbi:enoyl-CoA hydratase/isomerase family protein [Penicillium sp. IBT 31633x]|nr:enoyl-CoA hydratase/isomerase family protein [Penicillium sp. IBT 31633x]
MSLPKPIVLLPASYEKVELPDVKLTHYPVGTETVTPVVIVTLNRPEKYNAFTQSMASSLEQSFKLFHHDDRVKVVVLTGAGKMFCAGSDLEVGFGKRKVANSDYRDIGGRVSIAIHRCQKPTIVALQGSAVGVGMTMTLPATVRICYEKGKYGLVFARRGLTLESCSSFFLPRLVGLSRAMFLATTAGVYPPQERYFGNLFTEVISEAAQVLPRALELAMEMAEAVSPTASTMNRALLWQGAASPEEAHLLESRVFHAMITSSDHEEGVQAFFQKRKPNFRAGISQDLSLNYPWWYEANIDCPPKNIREGPKL